MAPSEPDFIGDCAECGQPRLAYTSQMQMREGAADWTDVTAITVKCDCGSDSPAGLDLVRRHVPALSVQTTCDVVSPFATRRSASQ
jgi:hypothetical protein